MQCAICNNQRDNQRYCIPERLFGYPESFDYFQCSHCRCLQIVEIPVDLERYYPPAYYTFADQQANDPSSGHIPEWLHTMMGGPLLPNPKGFINEVAEIRLAKKALLFYLRGVPLTLKSRILDVGCGSGSFLRVLHRLGFINLTGIDLFVSQPINKDKGPVIHKGQLCDLDRNSRWDLITFHHAIAHIPDQLATLRLVAELLSPGGLCLIRTPTVSSYAWRHYSIFWSGLDVPRAFYIHSVESMRLVAEKAGLQVQKVLYDSTSFQFWGSEQYKQGISLYSEQSLINSSSSSIFSHTDFADFSRRTKEFNETGQGDFVAFYLARPAHEKGSVTQ